MMAVRQPRQAKCMRLRMRGGHECRQQGRLRWSLSCGSWQGRGAWRGKSAASDTWRADAGPTQRTASTKTVDGQPPTAADAHGLPCQAGRNAAQHGYADRGDTDKIEASASSTLAAELRALRAQPRSRQPSNLALTPKPHAHPPQRSSSTANALSGVALVAADNSAARSHSGSAGDFKACSSARLADRASEQHRNAQPGKQAVLTGSRGSGFAAAVEQPPQHTGPEPARAPIFDGIRAIFDPDLDPNEAARCHTVSFLQIST